MLIAEERTEINGHEIILRNAVPENAQMMLDFIRTACKETRFLFMESDEMNLTLEQEIDFIERYDDGTYADDIRMVKGL